MKIWLSVLLLMPDQRSFATDRESRNFRNETEWRLKDTVFTHVVQHFGDTVRMDLKVSCANHNVARHISWRPDPKAVAADSFGTNWYTLDLWCFPPFSLISESCKTLGRRHGSDSPIPDWATQPWLPQPLGVSSTIHE